MTGNFWKVWGAPLLLGVLSTTGLIAALLGDGFWDGLSWFTLGAPVAAALWYLFKSRKVLR